MSAPSFTPRRIRKQRRRTALVAAVTGVIVAVGLVTATFLLAARSDDPQVNLGDDVFEVGRADQLAGPIERDGPLLFQDLVGRGRDLWVQHLGDDPEEGWLAFEAVAPGSERRCQLTWQPRQRAFRDPCTGRRHPADGRGLRHYRTTVEGGRVHVDLRRPATSTTSPD